MLSALGSAERFEKTIILITLQNAAGLHDLQLKSLIQNSKILKDFHIFFKNTILGTQYIYH